MAQGQGPFPLAPTAPFLEGGGIERLRTTGPHYAKNGLTYSCRTSLAAITIILPPKGYINVIDVDGNAGTNNITVKAPPTHTILDGAVGDNFIIDVAWFGCLIFRVPTLLKWSVS